MVQSVAISSESLTLLTLRSRLMLVVYSAERMARIPEKTINFHSRRFSFCGRCRLLRASRVFREEVLRVERRSLNDDLANEFLYDPSL